MDYQNLINYTQGNNVKPIDVQFGISKPITTYKATPTTNCGSVEQLIKKSMKL